MAFLFSGLSVAARQVAFPPEENTEDERDDQHRSRCPPEAFVSVNERQRIKVHAENGGDQVKWQENCRQRG